MLAISGALSPTIAIAAAIFITAGCVILITPFLRDLAKLQRAIEAMADNETAPLPAASPFGVIDSLGSAIGRLVRRGRLQSEMRAAEVAAAQSIIDSLPDPLLVLDEQRNVTHANPAATDLLEVDPTGRDLAAAMRHPAVLSAADAVLRGDGTRVVEFVIPLPMERHLNARLSPLSRPGSAGRSALLTLHDLTSIKRTERMRADFVANASHELRTPLATLSGFIETLRGPARDDPEAQDRFLEIMQGQTGRMARLIDDLLSLSRIEMNEHVPPVTPVDLGQLLQTVRDTLQLRAKARDMQIVLNVSAGLPRIFGDADELAQVFQNLMDNAVKYGRAGTRIEVDASATQRQLPGLEGRRPSVRVAVRDHGDGIAREHLPRLTERFYRVDAARSREVGGTGLGLAIVKHIVNRHRGTLDIESDLGRGSVFTVHLRALPEDTASIAIKQA